jgi:hypothetical protein
VTLPILKVLSSEIGFLSGKLANPLAYYQLRPFLRYTTMAHIPEIFEFCNKESVKEIN